VAPIYNYFGGN